MRPVPLALGLAALVGGLALAGAGLVGGFLADVGFALAALAAGVAALLSLLVRSVDGPESPALGSDPDRPGVRRPGDDVDRKLAVAEAGETLARDDLTERAEDVAVAVVARERDCSRDRARELLADGEWTEDDVAAALFRERRRRPTLTDRVRVFLGGDSTFGQRFDRTTRELWRRGR